MKMPRMIFALICLVGIAPLVWSQNESPSAKDKGVPGYLNPQTRTFTTKTQTEVSPNLCSTCDYYYGTIQVNLAVYVASSFPSGTVYVCSATASVDDSAGGFFNEAATVEAAPPSGGKTACTVNMPYYWQLLNPTTDSIAITFEVDAENVGTVGSQSTIIRLGSASRETPGVTGVPTTNGTVTSVGYYTRM
jgi:hypothetical protein